jgi:type III pantothenate kinase
LELVIDEGNSRAKAALFINNGLNKVVQGDTADKNLWEKISPSKPDRIIISSVRKMSFETMNFWNSIAPTLLLDHETPLPIENLYETPKTLGKDRIAGVVGGRFLIPEGNILVIDAGTCITYDVLNDRDQYLGGSISPGASLRFKGLHHYTESLPEVEAEIFDNPYGTNTNDAIVSGVMNGLIHEINGTIENLEVHFSPLNIVLCGGEAHYFVNRIKKKIFANQNLVLLGLHKILKFNDSE